LLAAFVVIDGESTWLEDWPWSALRHHRREVWWGAPIAA